MKSKPEFEKNIANVITAVNVVKNREYKVFTAKILADESAYSDEWVENIARLYTNIPKRLGAINNTKAWLAFYNDVFFGNQQNPCFSANFPRDHRSD